jgi:uncharacterized protein YdhG (YjbR/CyaY superfamily)
LHNKPASVDEYLRSVPAERRNAYSKLLAVIRDAIDPKFTEVMMYGMPGWVVSKLLYPPGYHVDPSLPVSFVGLANQKNYIALYHMGLYADTKLLNWFTQEYAKTGLKLDMGKSCVRFKKMESIPFDLIAELMTRMSLNDYLALYQANLSKQ